MSSKKSKESEIINIKSATNAEDPDPVPELDIAQIINKNSVNQTIVDVLANLVAQRIAANKLQTDPKTKSTNNFKIRAIQKAADVLANTDIKITSGHMALEHFQGKGVGKDTAAKIDEILDTGTLSELNHEVAQEKTVIDNLMTIKDIGSTTATRLYTQYNIKSVAELRELWQSGDAAKKGINITHEIGMGLKYYEDLLLKVGYDEIELLRPILEPILAKVDPNLNYEICGSHRRDAALSGDIDVLIGHQKILTMTELRQMKRNYLQEIVVELKAAMIIIDDLTTTPGLQYRGIVRLLERARHMDLHIVSRDAWSTALMHFTGNVEFNIRMRNRARTMGMTLTEYGLFKIKNGEKDTQFEINSERDIFKALNVKYLEPRQRTL